MPEPPPCCTHAILRTPSAGFARGLTTVDWARRGGPPNHARLLEQHAAYADALRRAGVGIELLPALAAFPDAHFVEDVAIVLDDLAIITRPGAESRRGEADHIAPALERHRPTARVDAPARLDGGDVLVVGETILVGRSARTDASGVEALAAMAEPRGYRVIPVPVGAGLHFKSSVNLVAPGVLLATRAWAGRPELAAFEVLVVPEDEVYAANALRVNDTVLVADGHPGTAAILRDHGLFVETVPMSESMKMDGGLTCLSLRFT